MVDVLAYVLARLLLVVVLIALIFATGHILGVRDFPLVVALLFAFEVIALPLGIWILRPAATSRHGEDVPWPDDAATRSPTTRRTSERVVDHAEVIVAAAERLLAERGSSFTTQDVTKEAGGCRASDLLPVFREQGQAPARSVRRHNGASG